MRSTNMDSLLDEVAETVLRQRHAETDGAILEALRQRFAADRIHVRVVRPRWMPERIYRALMRTIVIEEHAR